SSTFIGSPRVSKVGSHTSRLESARALHGLTRETRDTPCSISRVEPGAQAIDLWATGGSFGADHIDAQTRTLPEALASMAGVTAEAAVDQRVDLALGELV